MEEESKEAYSIHNAIGNLSILSDFDIDHPQSIGLASNGKFITDQEEISKEKILWFSEENIDIIREKILDTYIVVLEYFHTICDDTSFDWKSPQTKKGIREIIVLAGKTKDAVDEYIEEIKEVYPVEKIGPSDEFQALSKYYLEEVQKKFDHPLEGKEDWAENWKGKQAEALVIDKSALSNFDSVKDDLEYELFYLKNADGNPFFHKELLRNIELYCDFDQDKDLELDDPLLKMPSYRDKNLQAVADQIVKAIYHLIEQFYQRKKEAKDKKLFFLVNKVIMPLLLAANPKNLISKTRAKASTRYFEDMLEHLNCFLLSKEYNRLAKKDTILVDVIHALCYQLFLNRGGIKEEMIGFMHRLMRMGLELSKKAYIENDDTTWSRLIKSDDQMHSILKHFPNGPLFKILDAVREKVDGFYPLMQDNLPKRLFSFELLEKETTLLKIPSPTRQIKISEARIAPEFLAFLRGAKKQEKTLLYIQLQDRTSWKEHARVSLLESLQEEKEFKKTLHVVTIAKDTDFYYQLGSYHHTENAEDFTALFKEHLLSGQDYGYFFPKHIETKAFREFIPTAIDAIWDIFFEKRTALTRKNRLDFIEIFYHFLLLKIVETVKPDLLSLSCKDALDVGAVFSSSFYAFLSLLKGSALNDDFIRYLLYTEALIVRERAPNSQRIYRDLSALAYFDKMLSQDTTKKLTVLSKLFKTGFFKSIDIRY